MVFFSSSLRIVTAEHSSGFEIDVGYPKSDQIPYFTCNWKKVEFANIWSRTKTKRSEGFPSVLIVGPFLSGFDKIIGLSSTKSLLQCTLWIMWIQHHIVCHAAWICQATVSPVYHPFPNMKPCRLTMDCSVHFERLSVIIKYVDHT